MQRRYDSHNSDIDPFIKENISNIYGISGAISPNGDYAAERIAIRQALIRSLDDSGAGLVLDRLEGARGVVLQILVVDDDKGLPVFEGNEVRGHASDRYITIIVRKGELKNTSFIISKFFHEIRARSHKAYQKLDEFENMNLAIESDVRRRGRLTSFLFRIDFASLSFPAHLDIVHRDYASSDDPNTDPAAGEAKIISRDGRRRTKMLNARDPAKGTAPSELLRRLKWAILPYGAEMQLNMGENIDAADIYNFYKYVRFDNSEKLTEKARQGYFCVLLGNVLVSTLNLRSSVLRNALLETMLKSVYGEDEIAHYGTHSNLAAEWKRTMGPGGSPQEDIGRLLSEVRAAFEREGADTAWIDNIKDGLIKEFRAAPFAESPKGSGKAAVAEEIGASLVKKVYEKFKEEADALAKEAAGTMNIEREDLRRTDRLEAALAVIGKMNDFFSRVDDGGFLGHDTDGIVLRVGKPWVEYIMSLKRSSRAALEVPLAYEDTYQLMLYVASSQLASDDWDGAFKITTYALGKLYDPTHKAMLATTGKGATIGMKRDFLTIRGECAFNLGNLEEALKCSTESIELLDKAISETEGIRTWRGCHNLWMSMRLAMECFNVDCRFAEFRSMLARMRAIVGRPNVSSGDDMIYTTGLVAHEIALAMQSRYILKDVDATAIIARQLGELAEVYPDDRLNSMMKACLLFLSGDDEGMAAELGRASYEGREGFNETDVFLRLVAARSWHYRQTGRSRQSQEAVDRVCADYSTTDDKGSAVFPGYLFFAYMCEKDLGKASAELRQGILSEASKGVDVVSGRCVLALIDMQRALERRDAISLLRQDGELSDYATDMAELFSDSKFTVAKAVREWQWVPKINRDAFAALAAELLASGLEQVTGKARLNIILFLRQIQPGNAGDEEAIARLERLLVECAPPAAADGVKLKGREARQQRALMELASSIEQAIADIRRSGGDAGRIAYAKKLFLAARYDEALEELSGCENGGAAEYKEAFALAAAGVKEYKAFKFGPAMKSLSASIGVLRSIEEAELAAAVRAMLRACAKCALAERRYSAGKYDGAIAAADGVRDDYGAKFCGKLRAVRGALAGNDAPRTLRRIAETYGTDPHIRFLLASDRADRDRTRKIQIWAEEELGKVEAAIARAVADYVGLGDAMRQLDEVLRNAGFSRRLGGAIVMAAERALQLGLYNDTFAIIRYGLSRIPSAQQGLHERLGVIKDAAEGASASERLKRCFGIVDSTVAAENFASGDVLRSQGRTGAIVYQYDGVEKNAGESTITLSGFFFKSERSPEGDGVRRIDDMKSAVNRNWTYVIVFEDADGRQRQVVLKAVHADKERAVFNVVYEEDRQAVFERMKTQKGTIKKVDDTSGLRRREVLSECIGNLDRSVADGSRISTGYPLIDMMLGLARPPRPAAGPRPGSVHIKDKRVEEDGAQRAAVESMLSDEVPLTIIQGPPGTGKTSVIAEAIRQFYAKGKKVLVVSQSNQAVDNLGLRLVGLQKEGDPLKFARVGNNDKSVDKNIGRAYTDRENILAEMSGRGKGAVVLGTINGFFSDRCICEREYYKSDYDVVIIEEAGRATLDETLFPISKARQSGKVILVGDHAQLPPYVMEGDAKKMVIEILERHRYVPPYGLSAREAAFIDRTGKGKDLTAGYRNRLAALLSQRRLRQHAVSCLEHLWNNAPWLEDGVERHKLVINRRSHPAITKLVSRLFYKDTILPDPKKDPVIEKDTLKVIDYASQEKIDHQKARDGIYEKKIGKSYQNVREANIVLAEFAGILNQQKDGAFRYGISDITVITPYMPQRILIRRGFSALAAVNDIRRALVDKDVATSGERLNAIESAIDPELPEKTQALARAAIRRLAPAYGDGALTERCLLEIAPALMFDVTLEQKQPVTWDDIDRIDCLETETVDSIQGAENKVVILSLVRSNGAAEIGFMGTPTGLQRLCVAFSRAQEKFIVIGDFTHTLTRARYEGQGRTEYARVLRDSISRAAAAFKMTKLYYDNEIVPDLPSDRPAESGARQPMGPDSVKASGRAMYELMKRSMMPQGPRAVGIVIKARPGDNTELILKEKLALEMEIFGRRLGSTRELIKNGVASYTDGAITYLAYVDDGTDSPENRARLSAFASRLEGLSLPKERVFAWVLPRDTAAPAAEEVRSISVRANLVALDGEFVPVSWQMLAGPLFISFLESARCASAGEEGRVKAAIDILIRAIAEITNTGLDEWTALAAELAAADPAALERRFNGFSFILRLPPIGPLADGAEQLMKADVEIRTMV